MSKHMTIINLACTITKLRKWGEAWKHSAESAQAATAGLVDKLIADHEANMVEHRAAFGARTEADAQLITKLRAMVKEQSDSAKAAGELLGWTANESPIQAVERVVTERDGLLTQVQDLVAERDALRAEGAELKTQLERLTSWAAKNQAAPETLQTEIEKLKSQNPKQHPVKVGEWEPDLTQLHAKGKEAWSDVPNATQWVEEMRGNSEATHDTVQGKAAAESALNTDPMCVGDEVEVIGRSAPTSGSGMFTGTIAPIGTRGIATMIHGTAGFVELDNGTRASLCDVRKVPQ